MPLFSSRLNTLKNSNISVVSEEKHPIPLEHKVFRSEHTVSVRKRNGTSIGLPTVQHRIWLRCYKGDSVKSNGGFSWECSHLGIKRLAVFGTSTPLRRDCSNQSHEHPDWLIVHDLLLERVDHLVER